MTAIVHTKPKSAARGLKAFVVVVCLVILGLGGWRDWSDREQEIARINAEILNLAKSLVQHAEDTFEVADALLVDVVDRVESGGMQSNAVKRMDTFLVDRVQSLPRIKSLSVYEDDGFLLSSSLPGHRGKVNAEKQAFFQHHRNSTDKDWFFGPLIRDPLGGDWVLTLSRRIDKPDGSFGGVVQASIPPRYFANFFGRFDVGRQGSITLIYKDGTLLSRYPYIERAIGTDISKEPQFLERRGSGAYEYVSPIDGVTRMGGYYRNPMVPVGVLASVGQDEAMASWNREFVFRTVVMSVLVAIIATLGWILSAELRRREEAEVELSVLAATDGLTGLANRRMFDRQLEAAWLRAAREKSPVSLLLVDVDQFKAYNDIYGHQAGDECLRTIAVAIAGAARRPGDLAARYGGEELVVLLPDLDAAGAAAIAEEIRDKVETLRLRHEANVPSRTLTVSIGSATRIPSLDRSRHGPEDLITLADAALYRAKQDGRNRVATAKAA
ncbi:sensor domain-containing diguanylate cyclase [Microvirga lotononidis]|uniref:diguanylate cyclase n=1 Tax=Microvirga lotononidis TaxID=864069 RepID=I4YV34_9HYPH|nr:sensor domain-containing diguanylate cyclase [Microvirga lotononidis]EIM27826.1 diguanylate cyclase (GGDEF) domain-containing protein [Microvirga lotononidis]WQO28044.1 sensor domain-containing diguanylate cyclase [Microvirga lotononidis]